MEDGTRVLSQAGVAKSLGIYRATNLAKFVSGKAKYVYQPLAGSDGAILELLEEKNPKVVTKSGTKIRKHKLHSFLEKVGVDALRQHIWRLVGIGEASETKTEFERKLVIIYLTQIRNKIKKFVKIF